MNILKKNFKNYLSLGGSSLMTRKIGQKFCLFEDLKGATPSVLKEKEMFSGLSLLRKPPGCMSLRYSSPLNISQMSSFFRKSLSNLYPSNLMNSASVLNKINKLYHTVIIMIICTCRSIVFIYKSIVLLLR